MPEILDVVVDLFVSAAGLVLHVVQGADLALGLDLDLLVGDLDLAASGLVGQIILGANFGVRLPSQLLRFDLFIAAACKETKVRSFSHLRSLLSKNAVFQTFFLTSQNLDHVIKP